MPYDPVLLITVSLVNAKFVRSFVEVVLGATYGRSVDLVLNSLSGFFR